MSGISCSNKTTILLVYLNPQEELHWQDTDQGEKVIAEKKNHIVFIPSHLRSD